MKVHLISEQCKAKIIGFKKNRLLMRCPCMNT